MRNYYKLAALFGRALDEEHIPYMIIGGLAVNIHTRPRYTDDIDITLDYKRSDISPILRIADRLETRFLVEDPEIFVNQSHILPALHKDGIQIDIIFGRSEYESIAIRRAVTEPFEGIPVKYAAVEDLIVHKLLAARGVDEYDVRTLLVSNEKSIDFEYLERWLKEFDEELDADLAETLRRIKSDISHHR